MDKEIIQKRITFIIEKLEDLKYDLDKYEKIANIRDKNTVTGAIERWSEEIIESAISINNEILSSKNLISDSYYNSFILLKHFNIFDDNFIKKIASTSGFRNRLAHDYLNIDKEVMLKSARFLLTLYKEYTMKITEYINN